MTSDKDLSVGDSADSDEEEEEEEDKADLSVESAEDAGEVESSAKVGNPYCFESTCEFPQMKATRICGKYSHVVISCVTNLLSQNFTTLFGLT